MKKILLWLVTLMLVATFSLVGCKAAPVAVEPVVEEEAPAVVEEVEEEVVTEVPVELVVMWGGWPEEQVTPLMDAFMQKYPNVRLRVERVPFSELYQTLDIRLGVRTSTPDIYSVDCSLTGYYVSGGHLLDLDPVYGDELNDFVEAAREAGTYQGKLYSAPFASSSQLLFYNKDLFEKAGIEPPAADVNQRWTWEKVVEVAKQLNDPAKGIWGLAIEQVDPYQILPLPQSKGAEVLSSDGFTATGYVNSPKYVEALQFYQKLFTDWKISPAGNLGTAGMGEIFGTGQVAMIIGGTWNLTSTGWARFPDLNWGSAPHPYFEGGKAVTPTGSWHIGINPRTAHIEEAINFVKFMTSDEIIKKWFELRGYCPTKTAVYDMMPDVFDSPAWKIVFYELGNTAVPRPLSPGYRYYQDIIQRGLLDIQTGADVQEMLDKAAADFDKAVEKYK